MRQLQDACQQTNDFFSSGKKKLNSKTWNLKHAHCHSCKDGLDPEIYYNCSLILNQEHSLKEDKLKLGVFHINLEANEWFQRVLGKKCPIIDSFSYYCDKNVWPKNWRIPLALGLRSHSPSWGQEPYGGRMWGRGGHIASTYYIRKQREMSMVLNPLPFIFLFYYSLRLQPMKLYSPLRISKTLSETHPELCPPDDSNSHQTDEQDHPLYRVVQDQSS